jgi:medium-chain acyl-[acyl-carrier-protein] hydrolase
MENNGMSGKSKPPVWTETYKIRSYEVEESGNLSLISLANFMQDTAEKHAYALGFSLHEMLEKNYAWLLTRMLIKIYNFPSWKDEIKIVTWPSGIQKYFAYRDFRFFNTSGNLFGVSVSSWLLVDINTRRPVRLEPIFTEIPVTDYDRALSIYLEKIPSPEKPGIEKKFSVRYSDIDVNGHVNNVSYIEWIMESIPHELRKGKTMSELEINFLAETHLGGNIISACQPDIDNAVNFQHTVLRENDRLELARARTLWNSGK